MIDNQRFSWGGELFTDELTYGFYAIEDESIERVISRAIADSVRLYNEAVERIVNDPTSPYYDQYQRHAMKQRTMKSSVATGGKSRKAIRWRASQLEEGA